jgi:outer membrane lipoprotein-sorting protein
MPNYSKVGPLLLLLLSLPVFAQAQNPYETFKQFSATGVTSGKSGEHSMKIYRSGDKMRTDMQMGYMIMDLGQQTGYMVMNGMCMQMPKIGEAQQNPFIQAQDATYERSPAGTDVVDGHPCKVENETVTPRNGKPIKRKIWEAEDLKGFPIKSEMQTSNGTAITVEYKDVSFDIPPASLFTHPENCRQMPSMPGGPH